MSKTTKIVLIVIPIVMLLALAISFTVLMLRPEEDTPIDEPSGDKPINCIEDLSGRTYNQDNFSVIGTTTMEFQDGPKTYYYAVINLGVDNDNFVPPTGEERYHIHFFMNGKEYGLYLNPAATDEQYTYDTLLYATLLQRFDFVVCDEAYVKEDENLFWELGVLTDDSAFTQPGLAEGVQVEGYCFGIVSQYPIETFKIVSLQKVEQ